MIFYCMQPNPVFAVARFDMGSFSPFLSLQSLEMDTNVVQARVWRILVMCWTRAWGQPTYINMAGMEATGNTIP